MNFPGTQPIENIKFPTKRPTQWLEIQNVWICLMATTCRSCFREGKRYERNNGAWTVREVLDKPHWKKMAKELSFTPFQRRVRPAIVRGLVKHLEQDHNIEFTGRYTHA
jgi:hypothetical protein